MTDARARLIGINHVALEVGDIDAALEFYGGLFGFELRGRVGDRMAFLDAGDQFVALSAPRRGAADEDRHVGFVVDDRAALRAAARPWEAGRLLHVVDAQVARRPGGRGELRGRGDLCMWCMQSSPSLTRTP